MYVLNLRESFKTCKASFHYKYENYYNDICLPTLTQLLQFIVFNLKVISFLDDGTKIHQLGKKPEFEKVFGGTY